MRGKFITIEGVEGAGKSTAIQFIQQYLSHVNLISTREPGGTEIAEEIRKILLYPNNSEPMQVKTELLLMFASRAQHISQCIQPALAAGKWVMSDRYIDASYAYQGYGRGIEIEIIKALDKFVVGDLYPDLTILMDVPVEIGIMRAEQRNTKKDRIEHEQVDFFKRIRNAYLDRAATEPQRIKVIDASQSLTAVQEQIQQVLEQFVAGIKS